MTVAEHLRTARISKNLSLRALAAELKVTHTTIHAWETGRAAVPRARLHAVCEALGLEYKRTRALWDTERVAGDREQLERLGERLAARRDRVAS